MKILKFGGSSVASAGNINRVVEIILSSLQSEGKLAVVVSAFGGITDELTALARLAGQGRGEHKALFKKICQRHDQVVRGLIQGASRKKALGELEKKYTELEEIMENIFQSRKLSPQSLDAVTSFGEQLSAYIISQAIKCTGVSCALVDARAIIKTDDNFGQAQIDLQKSYRLIAKAFEGKNKIFVLGGFIASTEDGATTTLGRGGSDYTAALVGAALKARAVEIWTDVDGLMTSNPKIAKNARTIPEISYEEAEKMAKAGAKVIHPKTMRPAREAGMPIYIKNTFNPKEPGTRIGGEPPSKKIQEKIPVGILGATGMVGGRLMSLLKNHPWFEATVVAASKRSVGEKLGSLTVYSVEDDIETIAQKCRFVFSAVEASKDVVRKIEESCAVRGLAVVSCASAHRVTPDVPVIIPEINPAHLEIIPIQQKNHGWRGFIVAKPNCTLQSFVPLVAAWKRFGPKKVIVSTYQALSGAGKTLETWPEMADNIIPFIEGEEEKSEEEPKKILGEIKGNKLVLNDKIQISANCVRVPVSDGHLAAVNIRFGKKASKKELIHALRHFKNPLDGLDLPSAPRPFLTYFAKPNRPQTRLDRDIGGGMGISVGRLREDPVLGWKCVALSHNTIRGAAGGSILTAELLVRKGYIL